MADRPAAGAPTTEQVEALWQEGVDAVATLSGNADIRFGAESDEAARTAYRVLRELRALAAAGVSS